VGLLRRNRAFVVFAAIALVLPAFVSNTYYLSILAFMATRLMMVVGLGLLMGQAGQVSLGHAAFVGVGAYGAAILTTKADLNPWLAMVVAAAAAAGVATLIGIPTLKLRGHYLAMATLGFNEIAFILMVQLKGLTNGTDGITGIPSLRLGPLDFGQPRLYHLLVWAVALLIFLFSLNLADSRLGRALKALRRSEPAAASLGINTSARKLQVFVISAVFASLAGSFDAYYVQFVSPDSYTITFSIILVASVIIGGLGRLWGPVWGTLVIVLLPEVIKRFNQDATNLVFGLLLIAIMIFVPLRGSGFARWRGKGRAGGTGRSSGSGAKREAGAEAAQPPGD
jgi:branched-chain amino acid transport system permease protein